MLGRLKSALSSRKAKWSLVGLGALGIVSAGLVAPTLAVDRPDGAKEEAPSIGPARSLRGTVAAPGGDGITGHVSDSPAEARREQKRARAAEVRTAMPESFPSSRTLQLKHSGQTRNYWCGPATAGMIIKQLKRDGKISTTKSRYQGRNTGISQTALSKSTYMDANDGNGTQRTDMRRGLNRWIGHDWYSVKSNPSFAEFRTRVVSDIAGGYSVAVAAIERAGGPHYNGHPSSKTIDHWIAARGYKDRGIETKFADPATTVWSSVDPYFTAKTERFVNRHVRSKAIVW